MDWVNRLLTNKTGSVRFFEMFDGCSPKEFSCAGPNLIIISLKELHLCSQDGVTQSDITE